MGAAPVAIATDLGLGMVYVANSGDGTVSAIKGTARLRPGTLGERLGRWLPIRSSAIST